MVRFTGINGTIAHRAVCGVLCILMLLMASGCGVSGKLESVRNAVMDALGLGVDENNGPRVDPGTIINPFDPDYVPKEYEPVFPTYSIPWQVPSPGVVQTPSQGNSDAPGSFDTPEGTGAPDSSGAQAIDPRKFYPTVTSVATSEKYNSYLLNKVYTPVNDALKQIPVSSREKVYFRVFSSGQEFNADAGTCSPGNVFDSSCIGSIQYIGGTALASFVAGWLGQAESNRDNVVSARARWTSQIEAMNLDKNLTWLEASGTSGFDKKLLMMWGNERTSPNTLKDYLNMVESQAVGTIPDISFRLYTTSSNYSTITVNPTAGQTGNLHYQDTMLKVDVDRVFTKYNQFANRNCATIDKLLVDDSSILNCYLDGYNKTLIYLAVEKGSSLRDVLGSEYSNIIGILTQAARPNNGGALQGQVEGLTMVPGGVKGTG